MPKEKLAGVRALRSVAAPARGIAAALEPEPLATTGEKRRINVMLTPEADQMANDLVGAFRSAGTRSVNFSTICELGIRELAALGPDAVRGIAAKHPGALRPRRASK